jgi:hypothetical protein
MTMTHDIRKRASLLILSVLVACAVAACGQDQAVATPVANVPASPAPTPPAPTPPAPVAPPTIAGTPGTQVAVGTAYSFVPTASSTGNRPLTFNIQNRPAWAKFSATTGLLAGTPGAGDVGSYPNVDISVSDGKAAAALPAFSISVISATQVIPVNGACGSANGVAASSAPTSGLCHTGTASAVAGTGPWSWSCGGSNGGTTAQCSAPRVTVSTGPTSRYHFTPNANLDSQGNYVPGADGFNLADVSDVGTLNALPTGVMGLVWIGLCNGADSTFTASIQPFIGNPRLFGFYLMDEPDPTGQYAPLCTAANLKVESDWIHANAPGARTFVVLMDLGTPNSPSYANTYNPANTGIDLYGLDPYPIRPEFAGGADFSVINASVSAAEAEGIPVGRIVPVYQAFGGGGYSSYTLPTPAQAQQMLSTWDALVPSPVFDYTYSWGAQLGDQSLETTPGLQPIFLQHNTRN